jgi:spore germination protein GerM
VVSPASPEQTLTLLTANPLSGPGYIGLRSALPRSFEADITVARGVARVDAQGSFLRLIAPSDQRLAIAQIVATLTSRPGIGQVVFAVDGAPIAVPRGRGDLVPPGTPVTFDDYASLIIGG